MRSLLLAAVLLALPGAASAGPVLALRAGWNVASGDASKGTPMSDVVKSELPALQLDALWRFGAHFSFGAYGAFGFGRLSSTIADRCDRDGADCSVWTARVGIGGEYAFSEVSQRWEPWIGLAVEYEWARDSVSVAGESVVKTVSGWEWLVLDGGADVKVAPKLSIGPYATYRVGEYSRLSGYGIVNQAWHQWLAIGVRGKWDF